MGHRAPSIRHLERLALANPLQMPTGAWRSSRTHRGRYIQIDIIHGMEVGQLLQQIRRRHGLTQAELATRAGTSQPVISAYEHGRRDPTLKTLRKLVEAGGERLSVGALEPSPGPPPCKDVYEHGRRLADVLTLVDAIPSGPRSPVLVAPRMVSRYRC